MGNRHGEFQRHLLSFQPGSQSALITSSKCPPFYYPPQPSNLRSINNFNFQMPRNLAPFTILVLLSSVCMTVILFPEGKKNQMSYTKAYAELITHLVYSSLWFLRFLGFGRSVAPHPCFSLVSRSMSFLPHPLPVWSMGWGGGFPLFSSFLPHN